MAKKKKIDEKDVEKIMQDPTQALDNVSPEVIEKARAEMRATMREKFGEWLDISDETADDDFLQKAKADLEAEVEKVQAQTYLIMTHDDGRALKAAEFLKDFNTNYNRWDKGGWRGVIVFDKVIDKYIADLTLEPEKDFTVDYSTLIFLYKSMSEPQGMGLAAAKDMAKMENYDWENDKPYEENVPVTYSGILEKVFEHVRALSATDKKLNLYKERVTMAAAGVKFDFKISEIEEFLQLHEAWVVSDMPDDPKEIQKMAQ